MPGVVVEKVMVFEASGLVVTPLPVPYGSSMLSAVIESPELAPVQEILTEPLVPAEPSVVLGSSPPAPPVPPLPTTTLIVEFGVSAPLLYVATASPPGPPAPP